ncbi:hypothetical protein [Isoptericola sp. BMS4]|uniref:hypothetical protein n=1 Tax=Isoptericola sp. BMS4 TaxID=2527875 RepID=UPI0014245CAC|nr:hypothetical protein [Isoptericola sp. BMS4]
MSDETTFVPPALVRDYRRLLRLFPYAHRRAHGAEMLGHLLDGATPGRSRPTRPEVVDLLRAAAREWVLAPFGSTPEQRRSAAGWLLVLLPLVLAGPAMVALGSAASAVLVHDGAVVDGQIGSLLAWSPLLLSWVLWVCGMLALAGGLHRVALSALAVAAASGWVVLLGLSVVGTVYRGLFPVFTAMGWVVALTALAAAAGIRCVSVSLVGRIRSRSSMAAAAVAATLPVAAVVRVGIADDDSWIPAPSSTMLLGNGAMFVGLVVVSGVVLATRRGRHALPVLAGVGTAVGLGRIGLFASQLRQLDVVDAGNVAALLAASVAVASVLRWVVNRVDELGQARARLRAELAG